MIKVEFDMLSIWYFKLCERMSLFTESFHFGLLSEDRKKMSQSERERYREESRLRIDNYRRTCTELSTIAEQSEHSQFGQSLRRKDYSSLFTEADFAHLGRKSKSIQANNNGHISNPLVLSKLEQVKDSTFQQLSNNLDAINDAAAAAASDLVSEKKKAMTDEKDHLVINKESYFNNSHNKPNLDDTFDDLDTTHLSVLDSQEDSNLSFMQHDSSMSILSETDIIQETFANRSLHSGPYGRRFPRKSLSESNLIKSVNYIKPSLNTTFRRTTLVTSTPPRSVDQSELKRPKEEGKVRSNLDESVPQKPSTRSKSSLNISQNLEAMPNQKCNQLPVHESTRKSAQLSIHDITQVSISTPKKTLTRPQALSERSTNVVTRQKLGNKRTNINEMIQKCSNSRIKTLQSRRDDQFVLDQTMEAQLSPIANSKLNKGSKNKENIIYDLTCSNNLDKSFSNFDKTNCSLINHTLATVFSDNFNSPTELVRKMDHEVESIVNFQNSIQLLSKSPACEPVETQCTRVTRSKAQSAKRKSASKVPKGKAAKTDANQTSSVNGPNIIDAIKRRRNAIDAKKEKLNLRPRVKASKTKGPRRSQKRVV